MESHCSPHPAKATQIQWWLTIKALLSISSHRYSQPWALSQVVEWIWPTNHNPIAIILWYRLQDHSLANACNERVKEAFQLSNSSNKRHRMGNSYLLRDPLGLVMKYSHDSPKETEELEAMLERISSRPFTTMSSKEMALAVINKCFTQPIPPWIQQASNLLLEPEAPSTSVKGSTINCVTRTPLMRIKAFDPQKMSCFELSSIQTPTRPLNLQTTIQDLRPATNSNQLDNRVLMVNQSKIPIATTLQNRELRQDRRVKWHNLGWMKSEAFMAVHLRKYRPRRTKSFKAAIAMHLARWAMTRLSGHSSLVGLTAIFPRLKANCPRLQTHSVPNY